MFRPAKHRQLAIFTDALTLHEGFMEVTMFLCQFLTMMAMGLTFLFLAACSTPDALPPVPGVGPCPPGYVACNGRCEDPATPTCEGASS